MRVLAVYLGIRPVPVFRSRPTSNRPFGGFRQSLPLRRRRDLARRCEHLYPPILVVTFEKCSNPLGVLGRTDRRRQDPEPSGQHVLPVHSDLPGAAFVTEEQDVIVAFIDLGQQTKDNLEGLAYRFRILFLRLSRTALEKVRRQSAIQARVPLDFSV